MTPSPSPTPKFPAFRYPNGGLTQDRTTDLAISWTGITVAYGHRRVLDGVSLDVPRGSWLSLLGPNGAGKTTLLRTLASLRFEGRTTVLGRDLSRMAPRQRARSLALVPQHPTIPPGIGTFDYVALGRAPHQGIRFAPSIEDRRKALAILQRLDLERFARRSVDTLSGGERQRVVLARALVQDTPILVLDEPTSALDVGHQIDVLELVADLRAESDLTVITTIHDLSLAGQFADRVAVIADGELVADGRPTHVLTPELISTHWGVEADVEHDDDGCVTVTVRRRRESRRQSPRRRDPLTSSPTTERPPPTTETTP